MAKIIDDETMENVCILAKLSLSEEEKEKAKAEMQKMLDYVEKLDELDTSEVEPMSHIFQDENVFREDVVTRPFSSPFQINPAHSVCAWLLQVRQPE